MAEILVQCVVVLYNCNIADSQALSSLLEICRENPGFAERIAVLVQDNSASPHPLTIDSTIEIQFVHAPDNPGLAAAYNTGLAQAAGRGISWLLLLDQDTTLTREFLSELFEAIQSSSANPICAFVPELVSGRLVLSPQLVRRFLYRRLPFGFSGLTSAPLVAFNSAACLRIESVAAIGGFPKEYWLDYLDHVVFHRLQAAGGRVWVLGVQLSHKLSVENIEEEVSIDRYANVLNAEWMFIRETGARGGALAHRLRLLKRALSQSSKLANKSYARLTLRASIS